MTCGLKQRSCVVFASHGGELCATRLISCEFMLAFVVFVLRQHADAVYAHTYRHARTHAPQLTCARLHQMNCCKNYTACVICRRQPPQRPPISPQMYPSHPHQGPARAEGATCSLEMAAGTTMEFLLPSHSSLSQVVTSLLHWRHTCLHLLRSQIPNLCSSPEETLNMLWRMHHCPPGSQATKTCSCTLPACMLSSRHSAMAAPVC